MSASALAVVAVTGSVGDLGSVGGGECDDAEAGAGGVASGCGLGGAARDPEAADDLIKARPPLSLQVLCLLMFSVVVWLRLACVDDGDQRSIL